jgi:hypothetical protein
LTVNHNDYLSRARISLQERFTVFGHYLFRLGDLFHYEKGTRTMRKCLYRACASLVLFAACCASSFAQTTVVAVNFGGDVSTSNSNSTLDEGNQVVTDLGDFNNDTVTDARWRIPMDHAGNFANVPLNNNVSDISNIWAAGVEVVNYGTTTPTGTVGALFRFNGQNTTVDRLQAANAAGSGTSLGFVFAPHVRRANFLNGASAGETVSFSDDPNGFSFDWSWTGTASGPGNGRREHATVQNGNQWFISGTFGDAQSGSQSFNPYSETWYPWDVDTSLFFDAPTSGGVLGSTFTDIQALGMVMMNDSNLNVAANATIASVNGIMAMVDFTTPAPPTPPSGRAIARWSMDSVDTGVRLLDPFSAGGANEFFWNGDAVPDDAPGARNPLFFGDPIQPPGMPDAFFDTSRSPELTAGGQGVVGEALRFNGFEQDEALSIVGWPGDSSDSFVDDDLDSVYVNFYFQEDNSTNGAIQNLVGVRNTWEVRINPSGQVEWLTFLEGGGTDSILSDPLGAAGAWRHVEAWHDANGNKALYLDGVLVGISAPGALLADTASIAVGNRENQPRWFSGLIDEVYVGTGVHIPGDYNGDGTVDAADYTVWRDNLGGDARLAFAFGSRDGSLSGPIGNDDYSFWRANFGNTSGNLLVSAASVPEPSSLAMVLAISLAGLRLRRSL